MGFAAARGIGTTRSPPFLRLWDCSPNARDPCVFSGFVRDPEDPSDSPSAVPLTVGLYVDDFVYFSVSDEVEAKFERLLSKLVPVDFMGIEVMGAGSAVRSCSMPGRS